MMKRNNFPTLYAKSSLGKLKQWKITVTSDNKHPVVFTKYGLVGGKQQMTEVVIREGKNIGRSNETTPIEQAFLEALSKWTRQQERKKYTIDKSGESDILLPMLAHNYKKRGHKIEFPAYAQAKLNGIRCLAEKINETEIRYTSRGGKKFTTLKHLTPAILRCLDLGEIFDGELFTKELTFQEIVSAVKRPDHPNANKIQYWIYDMVVKDCSFHYRQRAYAHKLHENPFHKLVAVKTRVVHTHEDMISTHQHNVSNGYEGTIIRNKAGLYKRDFRSVDLQKYKDFLDAEFEIVGGKEGKGRAEGTVVWTCVTKNGKQFDVRPRGSDEQRRKWWNELSKYIGQKLTVRYQNLSDDGIPVFPVGISLRTYE